MVRWLPCTIRTSGAVGQMEVQPSAVADWWQVVDAVPEHCLAVVAELARDNAKTWFTIAERLERRTEPRAAQPVTPGSAG